MSFEQLRTFLAGRKTYGIALFGVIYLVGVWAGWWGWDEKVLAAVGLGGMTTLAIRVSRMLKPPPGGSYAPPKRFPSDHMGDN